MVGVSIVLPSSTVLLPLRLSRLQTAGWKWLFRLWIEKQHFPTDAADIAVGFV